LIAIPFLVRLGEILVRSGVANRTCVAVDRWVSWLPVGLVPATIVTATMFSAACGSSAATAAMPQAERPGYDPKLFLGAIAASGTLGIMIPPSIILIVYRFLTQSSIPQLFLAGLIPWLAMAFMGVTAIISMMRPDLGGLRRTFPFCQMLRALIDLIAILLLFRMIVGTIYLGWATPAEAAAVSVAGCLPDRAGLWRLVVGDAEPNPHGQDHVHVHADRDRHVLFQPCAGLRRIGARIDGFHDRPRADAAENDTGACCPLHRAFGGGAGL
jgi:TRAP-type mannitol/chloroaromatic compound transport system permease large subunit